MPPPDPSAVISVSTLAGQIKDLLETGFANIWVSGEISNFTKASSGHMYLTLKDAQSQIKCAFFRGMNLRLRFNPYDGLEVLARGQVSLYPQRGDCQFYIQEMQPKGLGAAELALRQLKEKLQSKGYFEISRKRALPRYPKRIALVASPTGAAIRDMLELLAQRWPLTEVLVRPSRVQGDGAAQEIAASLAILNRLHTERVLPLDAIVVGRGGGSSEDLSAFNEELVADAIFQSVVPVISAIGHEVDVSIADLVADRRAETPTAAIVSLVPDRKELYSTLAEYHDRFLTAMTGRFEWMRQTLTSIATRPVFKRPVERIRQNEQRLDDLSTRLQRAISRRLELANRSVASQAERLESLSPLNILKRGYSLTLRDGKTVRDAGTLTTGETLETKLATGTVLSRVIETRT